MRCTWQPDCVFEHSALMRTYAGVDRSDHSQQVMFLLNSGVLISVLILRISYMVELDDMLINYAGLDKFQVTVARLDAAG